ncbi:hypothetical protein DD238_007130 [Peronospora effusa]|uniref:Uncharacterized protein n=1 Tax=Peronospora effusa TaxID=542832 RepID=A0A3M6VDR3_9STRA|nr:hypothetical protein DD238_007130 [Peronospora effusa]RQM15864.1 hypothetical protein DD237_006699 [Peronospora effusa]RQM15865.1 hypothetical protein DD237_006692 [Peronospora effusa]
MQVGPSAEHRRARSQCIDNLGKQDCSAGLSMDSHGVKTPTTMQWSKPRLPSQSLWIPDVIEVAKLVVVPGLLSVCGTRQDRIGQEADFESAEPEYSRVGQSHAVV